MSNIQLETTGKYKTLNAAIPDRFLTAEPKEPQTLVISYQANQNGFIQGTEMTLSNEPEKNNIIWSDRLWDYIRGLIKAKETAFTDYLATNNL